MSDVDVSLTCALNLMRRMPPSQVENSLAGLIELVPHLTDELLNHVDQPLKIKKDPKTHQEYVLCDYNRDGDSFRSPWSNSYFPPMEDGFLPNQRLRSLEIEANKMFDIYRKQYFEGGYSSVYFFDTEEKDERAFGACFLIHKDVEKEKGLEKGWWDSIHVFEVNGAAGAGAGAGGEKNKSTSSSHPNAMYTYKLTTTVMVSLSLRDSGKVGEVDLSGSMTKQDERRLPLDDVHHTHLANLGTMLEDMELKIRNTIEGIYIQKTREVINGMRSTTTQKEKQWGEVTQSLKQAVGGRGQD